MPVLRRDTGLHSTTRANDPKGGRYVVDRAWYVGGQSHHQRPVGFSPAGKRGIGSECGLHPEKRRTRDQKSSGLLTSLRVLLGTQWV